VTTLLLGSCVSYDDISYQGFDNVQMTRQGKGHLTLGFDLKLDNPNNYNVKIKSSDIVLYIGGKELGQLHLNNAFTIEKKSQQSYPLSFDVRAIDLVKTAAANAIDLIGKKMIAVRMKGYVKGSVFGITQKRFIDETREVESSQVSKIFGK
jgi:LEA14-like dessication related protein